MRHHLSQFVRLLALGLLAVLLAAAVVAQRGVGQGRGRSPAPPPPRMDVPRGGDQRPVPPRRNDPDNEAARDQRGRERLPARWLERMREMPPEEQQRILSNNRRFREMSPEQQEEIRRRLQHWNSLTPQQRRAIVDRERIWREMTPEQRRRVRQEIFPRWEQLPPDRRQTILRRLHALQSLSESERAARLSDERFLAGLNGEDRELLRELARLRVGPAGRGPEEVPPE